MPEKVKESVQPSRGFLSRIFGSEPMTPEIQEGVNIARKENPNMAPVEPYGFFSRLLQPNAQAYASPGRSLYVNPTQMQGLSPQDVADTLTHEQQHINQMQNRGYGPGMELLHQMFGNNSRLPYGQRPDEMDAFQAEKNRRYSMGRTQTSVPSFTNPGEYYIPQGDINLPNPNKPRPKPSVIMPKTMY